MSKNISSVPLLEIDENEVRRNKRGIPWVRLIDALSQEGCPICHSVLRSAHEHLDNLLYENVNDVSVRMKLHASLGFCNYHAQLACEVERELHSDGQHLGTIHVSLLHAELGFLEEAAKIKRTVKKRRHPLSHKATDPIV